MATRDLVLLGLGPSHRMYLITLGLGTPAALGPSGGYRARSGAMDSTYRSSPGTQDTYLKAGGMDSSYRKSNDE